MMRLHSRGTIRVSPGRVWSRGATRARWWLIAGLLLASFFAGRALWGTASPTADYLKGRVRNARQNEELRHMDYQHARTLLKRHAGVGLSTDDDLQSSLTAAVWELQRSGKSSDFAQTFREILSCLEVVNQEINGPIPSELVERVSLPDVELVHAVSTILHAGWLLVVPQTSKPQHDSHFTRDLIPMFWAISHAWTQILEGDVDSLTEDLRLTVMAQELALDGIL
jgi:hypothetical protein